MNPFHAVREGYKKFLDRKLNGFENRLSFASIKIEIKIADELNHYLSHPLYKGKKLMETFYKWHHISR